MKIPKGFSIQEIMNGAMPGDITLGEARAFMLQSPELKSLASMVKSGRSLGIRYLRGNTEEQYPDTMLLSEFRTLVLLKQARLSVDDSDGGVLQDA